MQPHPTQTVPSAVAIPDVLGFAAFEETSKRSMDSGRAPKGSNLPEAAPSSDIPPSVDDLDISHL